MQGQSELWDNLRDFYGIDPSFPANFLYRYHGSNTNKIVLLNQGLHEIMQCRKKYKLEVICLGLKMFEKNRLDKSEGNYRLM